MFYTIFIYSFIPLLSLDRCFWSLADHNRSMRSRKTTSESDTTLLKATQPHTARKDRKPKARKILNTNRTQKEKQEKKKKGQKSWPTGLSQDIYFNWSSYSCKDRSTHKQPSTLTLIYLALYGPNVSSAVRKKSHPWWFLLFWQLQEITSGPERVKKKKKKKKILFLWWINAAGWHLRLQQQRERESSVVINNHCGEKNKPQINGGWKKRPHAGIGNWLVASCFVVAVG